MSENQQQYKALALFSLLALTPSSFVISSYTITSTAVPPFPTYVQNVIACIFSVPPEELSPHAHEGDVYIGNPDRGE